MYEITAFVAERPVLANHFMRVGQDSIVELGFKSFAMIPIEDRVETIIRDRCSIGRNEIALRENTDEKEIERIIRTVVESLNAAKFAFIAAEYWGGEGHQLALVFDKGRVEVYCQKDDPWPNTNISMALKSIGVPEKLEKKLDAFDVLGLGRYRSSKEWLAMPKDG
jgi:hypothetical protein